MTHQKRKAQSVDIHSAVDRRGQRTGLSGEAVDLRMAVFCGKGPGGT